MKKTVIFVALTLTGLLTNAQEVIELKAANVSFDPTTTHVVQHGNSFTVDIKEAFTGEFERDPVEFMKTNFDMAKVLETLGVEEKYSYYNVMFKSKKGELNANYNDKGKLLSFFSKFENIAVPSSLQHQLYRNYKGWAMVENSHVKRESNGSVTKDFYRVTMKKGNKKKNLKIQTSDIENSVVVAMN